MEVLTHMFSWHEEQKRGYVIVRPLVKIEIEIDRIAVIAVAPTDRASFVYNYVQTRPKSQYNGKWPFSLVYVLKRLITPIRAITSHVILAERA